MAAGALAAPGTTYGPCEGDCHHTDCAATRALAEAPCVHCEEPIGYDRRFYAVSPYSEPGPRKLAHASCHEAAIEAEVRNA